MGKRENLIGKKFNHLTPKYPGEDYIDKAGHCISRWWCECDCGNPELILIRGTHLKNGHTKSCGCLREKTCAKNGKNSKKFIQYNLMGEYGIGWTSNTNKEFYFDLEDYDKIKDYCWYENARGYIVAHCDDKTVRLNRIVMDCDKDGIDVDHIRHDLCDNRKSQLRICTHQKNTFNAKKKRNNTSGITGVYFDKARSKWVAEIRVNNKKIFLGRFKDKKDAIIARKKAEERYFGEFSYDNSMKFKDTSDAPDMEEVEELIMRETK